MFHTLPASPIQPGALPRSKCPRAAGCLQSRRAGRLLAPLRGAGTLPSANPPGVLPGAASPRAAGCPQCRRAEHLRSPLRSTGACSVRLHEPGCRLGLGIQLCGSVVRSLLASAIQPSALPRTGSPRAACFPQRRRAGHLGSAGACSPGLQWPGRRRPAEQPVQRWQGRVAQLRAILLAKQPQRQGSRPAAALAP